MKDERAGHEGNAVGVENFGRALVYLGIYIVGLIALLAALKRAELVTNPLVLYLIVLATLTLFMVFIVRKVILASAFEAKTADPQGETADPQG
jgi:hypothetical protein